MDYIFELAQHPDIHEAIALAAQDKGPGQEHARALCDLEFLREEHRTAWAAEVVHRFYREPALAAEVWRLLRYCRTFRLEIAENAVGAQANRLKAVVEKAEELASPDKRREIDDYCRDDDAPPPPYFLRTVMEASGVSRSRFDTETLKLLKSPREVRARAKRHGVAVPFNIVLDGELDQIVATRERVQRVSCEAPSRVPQPPAEAEPGQAAFRRALDANLFGLAFSGGGIRSATFNLGILQALSQVGLLRQVDYLSTVSGGGYIGSWLATWVRRESIAIGETPAGVTTMLDMQRRLSPARSPNPMDERVRPLRFLREYSNYLTPRSGFFSADTWTMIGIYLRNTLLNQVIIVSLLAASLLLPRLWFAAMRRLPPLGSEATWPSTVAVVLWCLGTVALIVHLVQLRPPELTAAPSGDRSAAPIRKSRLGRWTGPRTVHYLVVLPWTLAAALGAALYSSTGQWADQRDELSLAVGAIVGITLFVVVAGGRADRCWQPRQKPLIARTALWNEAEYNFKKAAERVGVKMGDSAAAGDGQAPVTAGAATTGAAAGAPATGAAATTDTVATGKERWRYLRPKGAAALVMALSAAVTAIVASGLTWVLLRSMQSFAPDAFSRAWHGIALGTAGLLSVLSLSIVVMLGMLGENLPDEHREWWSRFRTCVHMWALAWLAGFVAAVYVPWGFHLLILSEQAQWAGWTSFLGWLATTAFGVLRGRTAEDDAKLAHEAQSGGAPLSTSALRLAFSVAPYVFIVGLVVAISIAIDRVYAANLDDWSRIKWDEGGYWAFASWAASAEGWTPLVAIMLVGAGALFSWRVDINDFSLHHFYKNRLVRCYLGASRQSERQADWFTGFDPRDDVRLEQFDHARTGTTKYPHHAPYPGPYPLINCALNLIGGEDLAWQERKSTSFVFTPKFCGYDVDRAVLTKSRDGLREDGYVPTANYYHPGEGPLLGMAMAISGAAANPNMGRASSPALAFLMTVFNVRLGWWLRNPRYFDGSGRPSPPLGLPYTALELFGGTDDRRKFVNLSDGGHFENLGAYELIRRGCRYIVVCDAGQDEHFNCEDLGNLVRLCRTDFGVEIDIDLERVRTMGERASGTAPLSRTHCVVGTINYHGVPERDGRGHLLNSEGGPLLRGAKPSHEKGYLLYIKASLTGDEPPDILEYNRRVPGFPHQTTADQWFDESQFESYRKLGMHIGETTFGRYQDDDTKPLANLKELFRRLYGYWHPPVAIIDEKSTALVGEYTRILEMIRGDAKFAGLDRALFENAPASGPPLDPRDRLFMCNSMIQLMENVYADIDLERLYEHPHVQGWMSVFRRWAQRKEFRDTWRVVEPTYAERFRNFYNDRLQGRSLALPRSFVAGHRGIPSVPGSIENTIAAFEEAIRRGANVVEMDVRVLACGTLVVWHDDHVEGVPLTSFTLAQLREWAPHVTTFGDALEKLLGRVQLAIEVKVPGIERQVCNWLGDERYGGWRRRDVVMMASTTEILFAIRAREEAVRTGLIVETDRSIDGALGLLQNPEPDEPRFLDLPADFLAVDQYFLTDTRLAEAAVQRVPIVPWTVNDERRLTHLLRHEAVAGVITDTVALAVEVRRRL